MLRRVSGTNVTIKSVQEATRYTDRARQARTYRKGRVLLAGDAAHVHSPFGGQGMNTGLGDAMNLGWKLAATIKGWAPRGLLDTYTAERHPIVGAQLDTRAGCDYPARPARTCNRYSHSGPDRNEGRTNYFAEKISGVFMQYDLGKGHPLMGRSAPDYELADDLRLGDLLHAGTGLLLDFSANEFLHSLCAGREKVATRSREGEG